MRLETKDLIPFILCWFQWEICFHSTGINSRAYPSLKGSPLPNSRQMGDQIEICKWLKWRPLTVCSIILRDIYVISMECWEWVVPYGMQTGGIQWVIKVIGEHSIIKVFLFDICCQSKGGGGRDRRKRSRVMKLMYRKHSIVKTGLLFLLWVFISN